MSLVGSSTIRKKLFYSALYMDFFAIIRGRLGHQHGK